MGACIIGKISDGNSFVRFAAFLLFLTATTPIVHAQEREWSLNASEKEAFLVFGVPDSDDVGISFWCEIGSNKTSIFINDGPAELKQNQGTKITVSVDSKMFSVKARAALDRQGGRPSLEGQMTNADPLLKAAETGDVLKVTVLSQIHTYPLVDADFIGLHRNCASDSLN